MIQSNFLNSGSQRNQFDEISIMEECRKRIVKNLDRAISHTERLTDQYRLMTMKSYLLGTEINEYTKI